MNSFEYLFYSKYVFIMFPYILVMVQRKKN